MSILYLILILLIIVGATWWVGSWNITLNLINFFVAALVASNFFEPLADLIESFNASYTYLADFVAIWALFALTFIILRTATDMLTKYQMQMNIWVEYGLRTVLSLWLAGGFICFTYFTFHLAPFAPADFVSNPKTTLYGIGPDRMWMAFIQSRSRGALAEAKDAPLLPEYKLAVHPDDVELEARVFDPYATFGATYLQRRVNLSKSETLRVFK